jgi:hypothetical protein
MRRTLAALVASATLTAGGVALLAPSPADAATQVVAQTEQGKGLSDQQKAVLKEKGHITVTRTTKKGRTVTVLVQRGQITALTATSVSLKSTDGYTHSYLIGKKTKVKGQGVTAVGQRAQVIAVQTDKGDVARRLRHGFRQAG